MKDKIIGRKSECEKLQHCLNANTSQLVIVYGRRRVGKTFLINQFFDDEFTFKVTGIFNKPKDIQLQTFTVALNNYFDDDIKIPSNWIDAFNLLRKKLHPCRPTSSGLHPCMETQTWPMGLFYV